MTRNVEQFFHFALSHALIHYWGKIKIFLYQFRAEKVLLRNEDPDSPKVSFSNSTCNIHSRVYSAAYYFSPPTDIISYHHRLSKMVPVTFRQLIFHCKGYSNAWSNCTKLIYGHFLWFAITQNVLLSQQRWRSTVSSGDASVELCSLSQCVCQPPADALEDNPCTLSTSVTEGSDLGFPFFFLS